MSFHNHRNPLLDISEYYLPLDMKEVFHNTNESALEIGFGDGDFLLETARKNSKLNFIGLEIKRSRFQNAVKRAKKEEAENIKFLHMDAKIALDEVFKPSTFSIVYINFPDPWPKDKHKKHRIINNKFLERLSQIMKTNGVLEIASDHRDYINHILEVFKGIGSYKSVYPPPGYTNTLPDRPETKFETEYRTEGRNIYYLTYLNQREIT